MPGRKQIPSFKLATGTTNERDYSYNLNTLGSIFYNTDTSNVEVYHKDPSNTVGWRDLVMNNKEQIDISGKLVVDGDVSFNAHISAVDASFQNNVDITGKLVVSGNLAATGMIIQTQHTFYRTSATINSGSGWRAVPFSVTITPSSANSKILISTTIHYSSYGDGRWFGFRLYKNDSVISDANNNSSNALRNNFMNSNWGAYGGSGDMERFTSNVSNTYLDSPSTTSAITYQLYCNARTGNLSDTTTFYINRPHSNSDNYRPEVTSYIMAQEIYNP